MWRILWWTGKELREHRVVLVLLLVGLIVGSWFWAWTGVGRPSEMGLLAEPTASAAPIPHRYARVGEWELPLSLSLGVVLVVLAGGLFASDLRRGCSTLAARVPGGWGAAFAGKLLFLFAALLCTLALHGFVLGRLAALYDLRCPDIKGGIHAVDEVWLGPVSQSHISWIYALFAAAPVLLLASMTAPYMGVPAVLGAAVALALALPFAWLGEPNPFFLKWWLGSIRPLLALGAIVSLAIGAWVWWGHVRAGRSRPRVALHGASALLLVAGATFGAAGAARAAYREFSLSDADVQIHEICVGLDGQHAFVMAGRGDPRPTPGSLPSRGSRARPFTIDLATGASAPIAGISVVGVPTPYTFPSRIDAPVAWLHTRYLGALDGFAFAWMDTRTGAEIARAETGGLELPAVVKEVLEAGTERRWALELPAGGHAWLDERGLRVRSGAELASTITLDLPATLGRATSIRRIPGGWALQWGAGGAGPLVWAMGSGSSASVEASNGRVRHLTFDRIQPRGMVPVAWLTPREVLLTPDGGAKQAAYPRRKPASDPRTWRVLDLDAGASRPALSEGAAVDVHVAPQGVLGPTSVLVHEPGSDGRLLVLDLGDGRTRPVTWDRDPPARVHHALCMQQQLTPTETGGVLLLDLVVDEASVGPRPDERVSILQAGAWVGGGTTMEGKQRLRHVVAVVGADGSAWRLEVQARLFAAELLGIDAQGRVWMLEDARQIVRYGPGTGVREVLFPRAP